jgi:hypothetical protein
MIRSWCGANVDGKKKSDEGAKKKQKKGMIRKSNLCSPRRSFNICLAEIVREESSGGLWLA